METRQRWCNVNLDDSRITVSQSLEQTRSGLRFKSPKTERSRRVVVLPAFATELLRAHKIEQAKARLKHSPIYNDNDLVIPKENGEPWSPDVFSTAFASFIRRSKLLHVRFHDLRHSHATQLFQQGVHPKIVSERLGHSNIAITLDTYSHVLPGMQEDAAQKIDASLRSSIGRFTE